jgi:hypothetical protein
MRLGHFPSQRELQRRLREQEQSPSEIPLLPDFANTLTSGIDDTVQHLKIIQDHSIPNAEADILKHTAVKQLTDEVRTLRGELAQVIATVNMKASKGQLKEFAAGLTARVDKRVENLFKVVGVMGVAIGLLIAFKR